MSFIANAVRDLTGANQQADAIKSAANTQATAANNAAALQNAQFQQTQQNLAPYMSIGTAALPQLIQSLGYQGQYGSNGQLTGLSGQGFQFNPSNLENTPGYQFTLQQGMNALNNAGSATGQNQSGAQAKGLANYATGLALNTYNQQYQNALTTYQQNASILGSLLSTGQNAAAGIGSMGMQNAQSVGNTLMSGANATAAGQVAAGSSQTNALNSLMGLGMGGAGIYALGAKSGMNSALSSGASSLYNGITGLFSAGAGAGAVGTGAGASHATIAAFA